jgi:glutamate-1-semialdehyde 2,1-aminomutase
VRGIITAALTRHGVVHQAPSAGNLFSFFFTENPVMNYDDARTQNTSAFATFFHAMLDRGVWLPPSAYEAWFVSAAHTDDDLAIIESAADAAAEATAAAAEQPFFPRPRISRPGGGRLLILLGLVGIR